MEILIIFFLILLNGIFAMSEIAMVSSRKARLQKAARNGDRSAIKALQLAENPGKFLSTVQIGITLIGILTGIYSGEKIEDDLNSFLNQFAVLAPYSHTLSVTIIVVLLTFFSLVLGELVPKRIGMTVPEKISKVLAFPMYFISVIAAPFIWLLTITSDLLIRVLNIKKPDSAITEDEIKAFIKEGTEAGSVQEIEQEIVENVFHLGDRKVSTLMTQHNDVEWIDVNISLDLIRQQIINSTHHSFPVAKEKLDNIEGVVFVKDILNSLLNNQGLNLQQHIRQPFYISENSTAYKTLEKLREEKQQMAMVVDEFGAIKGIITMHDIIDALVGDLESQLHESREIVPRDDGTYLVDASIPLPEFLRYFEIELSDDDDLTTVNTLGGLIFYTEKKIPQAGYHLQWKNIQMEILDMDGRRIDKVLVKYADDKEN